MIVSLSACNSTCVISDKDEVLLVANVTLLLPIVVEVNEADLKSNHIRSVQRLWSLLHHRGERRAKQS